MRDMYPCHMIQMCTEFFDILKGQILCDLHFLCVHINEIWQGRLLDQNEVEIFSKHLYSTLVCFKGTFKINDKEVPEMTYLELKQNKIYNIDSSDSFVGLFEEGYA